MSIDVAMIKTTMHPENMIQFYLDFNGSNHPIYDYVPFQASYVKQRINKK